MTSTPTSSVRSKKAVVLYDGDCAFCRKSVGILRRLDWIGILEYQNARSDDPLPETPIPLGRERLLEEMHLVTPDHRTVHHGFGAFRWMAWRLPLLVALAPWLYLPFAPKLGQKLYLWVARNRFHLAPCQHGVCSVSRKSP